MMMNLFYDDVSIVTFVFVVVDTVYHSQHYYYSSAAAASEEHNYYYCCSQPDSTYPSADDYSAPAAPKTAPARTAAPAAHNSDPSAAAPPATEANTACSDRRTPANPRRTGWYRGCP